jgi:hypothetical protein
MPTMNLNPNDKKTRIDLGEVNYLKQDIVRRVFSRAMA